MATAQGGHPQPASHAAPAGHERYILPHTLACAPRAPSNIARLYCVQAPARLATTGSDAPSPKRQKSIQPIAKPNITTSSRRDLEGRVEGFVVPADSQLQAFAASGNLRQSRMTLILHSGDAVHITDFSADNKLLRYATDDGQRAILGRSVHIHSAFATPGFAPPSGFLRPAYAIRDTSSITDIIGQPAAGHVRLAEADISDVATGGFGRNLLLALPTGNLPMDAAYARFTTVAFARNSAVGGRLQVYDINAQMQLDGRTRDNLLALQTIMTHDRLRDRIMAVLQATVRDNDIILNSQTTVGMLQDEELILHAQDVAFPHPDTLIKTDLLTGDVHGIFAPDTRAPLRQRCTTCGSAFNAATNHCAVPECDGTEGAYKVYGHLYGNLPEESRGDVATVILTSEAADAMFTIDADNRFADLLPDNVQRARTLLRRRRGIFTVAHCVVRAFQPGADPTWWALD